MAQRLLPVFAYFLATNLQKSAVERGEKAFVLFSILSILIGWLNQDSNIFPVDSIKTELVLIDNQITSRSYSMAGLSLGTGWICGVSFGFLLWQKAVHKSDKIKKAVGCAILIAGNLLTFSRGGVFFMAIVFVVFLVCKVIEKGFTMKPLQLFFIVTSVAILLVIFAINYEAVLNSCFFQRYLAAGFSSLTDGSNRLRYSLHDQALAMAMQNFVIGRGFGFVGGQAVTSAILGAFPTESTILMIWIEAGIFAVIFFMLSAAKSILSMWKLKEKHKYIALVLGTLAWCFMMTTLEGDLNATIFWYWLGCLNNPYLAVDGKTRSYSERKSKVCSHHFKL